MNDRARFARTFLEFLERNGVAACVLGDARDDLAAIPSDLDVVVGRAALADVPRLVARFCRERDLRLVQFIRHERTAAYFVVAWRDASGELDALALDVCSDYVRRARRLLSADELLSGRVHVSATAGGHGFFVPAPHLRFIYYLLKKIDKLELGENHGEYLSDCWRLDSDRAAAELRRFWRARGDAELLAEAAATGRWWEVRSSLPRLRSALHRALPLAPSDVLGDLRRRLARVLRPTGAVVAFVGADGSGKSSVIERVLRDLAPVFRRTLYLHLRPRIVVRRGSAAAPVTAPHGLPPRGAAASAAKLALFVVDHVAGFAVRVWPAACRSTLIAFDRHYRDLLVDPKRYRYGGSMALARWAALLVPDPDLWLLLDAPPELLQARKREVSADESARQRRRYLAFARSRRNAVIVDATQTLDRVAAAAEDAVLRFLAGRLEFRHRELRLLENPLPARLLQQVCRKRTPLLGRLVRIALNSDVYCRIWAPVHMPHPYGIVIHSKTDIGSGVTVMQQVTLGGKDWGENYAPVIEDGAYIGAGARVLGAVRVGRGAIVGANAVVTRDVPPGCTVVGANRIVGGRPRECRTSLDVGREREASSA
jgi:serine acetyltransferase